MKKKLLTAALAGVLCFGTAGILASCNNNDDEPVVTHDFGDGVNALDMFAPEGEVEHVKMLVDGYNNAARKGSKENLTIKLRVIEKSEGAVGGAVETDPGAAPLFLHMPGDKANPWLESSVLANVDLKGAAINGEEINVNDNGILKQKDGESVYGAAFTFNTYFMLYNKQVFKNADDVASFDTMNAALKKYNEAQKSADDKISFALGMEVSAGWQTQSFVHLQGVKPQGDDGADTLKENNAFLNKGNQYYSKLLNNFDTLGYYMNTPVQVGAVKDNATLFNTNATTDLSKGATNRIAAMVGGTWTIPEAEKAVGKGNLGIAKLPSVKLVRDGALTDEEMQLPLIKDFKYLGINRAKLDSKSYTQDMKDSAKEFLKYTFTPEGQALRYQGKAVTPAVAKDPTLIKVDADKKNPEVEAIIDFINANPEHTYTQPVTVGWSEYWANVGPMTEAVLRPDSSKTKYTDHSKWIEATEKWMETIGTAVQSKNEKN